MSFSFDHSLRALLATLVFLFLFFGTSVHVSAENVDTVGADTVSAFTVQTPYSQVVFDNPWQVAFETVYANGFSLQRVELLADNTWAIHGLATLPTDAGAVLFLVPTNVIVDNLLPTTPTTIRPFLATQAILFSSSDSLSSSERNSKEEAMEFIALSRTHNFTGTVNTSSLYLSAHVVSSETPSSEDPSVDAIDTNMALIKLMVNRFNFTTPYHDLTLGVAFLHATRTDLDSIHVGTARIFNPTDGRLTSSVSVVTQHTPHFVVDSTVKLLQVAPGQNYLTVQFSLLDGFYEPLLQQSKSKFFLGSSASPDTTLWKPLCDDNNIVLSSSEHASLQACSSTHPDASLPLCRLVANTYSATASDPITVPISYTLLTPLPYMQDEVLANEFLFIHFDLHANVTQRTATAETHSNAFMGWNLKIPFQQSLTPCFNEILIEQPLLGGTHTVTINLYIGRALTPLTQDLSDNPTVSSSDVTAALPLADIRAISLLDTLQTLALFGDDNVFKAPSLDSLQLVDVTLVHVRDTVLYGKLQKLMQLGLAYSVEEQRLKISQEMVALCTNELLCFIDPIMMNQLQVNENTINRQRIHVIEGDALFPEEDLTWVNSFIGDKDAAPTIGTQFLQQIYSSLEPNARFRRVHLLDTRHDWPELHSSNAPLVITLATYKVS
jgi:hypothetical protein